MPLTRYQIRNEYSLADPDLYRAADKDDPEAVLEGVAMAGLIGVLRQLGDLAEFAAEIFHDLHEAVMATAERGHGLMVRVRQLEAEVPAVEKAFLSETNHSSFFTNAGVDWHPILHAEQNLITRGDLPRCVMDSYEECWGPPRLFLLDKFDVAGAGACLKRYTDPSFFENETATSKVIPSEVQREKKMHKTKKKGSHRKDGETPERLQTSHAKLHQLFLEERIENAFNDPACLVKLKKRQLNGSPLDVKSGKSYMEKFIQTPSPEHKAVYETSVDPPLLKLTSDNSSDSEIGTVEIGTISPVKRPSEVKESICSLPNALAMALKLPMEELNAEATNWEIAKASELAPAGYIGQTLPIPHRVTVENELIVNGEKNEKSNLRVDIPDEITSEVENYMDALATMELNMEAEDEHRPDNDLGVFSGGKFGTDSDAKERQLDIQRQSSDSQPIGVSTMSDDGYDSSMKCASGLSYSDTISNIAENVPCDTEELAKPFSATVNSASKNETSSSIELLAQLDIQGSSSIGLVQTKDAIVDERRLRDHGEASVSSCVTDSNCNYVSIDREAYSGVSPKEYELDEACSDSVGSDSESLSTDEIGFNRSISREVVSMDHSQKNIVCNDSPPVDESHSGEENISSDALMCLSKISELDPENKSSCNVLDQVHQIDFAEENSADNSALLVMVSPKSTTIPLEEQLSFSLLPEAEAHSDNELPPDMFDVMRHINLASKVDSLSKDRANSAHTSPLVKILQNQSTNEQLSDRVHSETEAKSDDKLQPEMFEGMRPGNSASEVDTFSNITVHSEYTTPLVEILRSQSTHEQLSERLQDVPNVEPDSEELRESNLDKVSGPADGGEITELSDTMDVLGRTAVTLDHKASCLDGSNLKGHLDLDDPPKPAVLSEDVALCTTCSTIYDDDCDNLGFQFSGLICSPSRPPWNPEELHSGAGVPHEQVLKFTVITYPESLICSEAETAQGKVNTMGSDSVVNKPSSCREDAVQNSALTEPMDTPIPGNNEDVAAPHSNLPDSETHSEQLLELTSNQIDGESLCGNDTSSNLSNLSYRGIQPHIDQQVCYVFHKLSPGNFPGQHASVGVSAQSADQEIDSNKHPLVSIPSGFGLVHKATHVGMDQMAPLPPLPPMQWRMGKAQRNSHDSQRELVEHAQGSFSLTSECGDDSKGQLDFSALEMRRIGHGNIYPPSEAVEHHVSERLVDSLVLPTDCGADMSNMFNEVNNQQSVTRFENMQSSDRGSAIAAMPHKRTEYGSLAEENDREQSSKPFPHVPGVEQTISGHDLTYLLESQTKPSDQYMVDTAVKGAIFQDILHESEAQVENSLDMSVTHPAKVQEQPPNNQVEQAPDNINQQIPAHAEVKHPTESEEQPQVCAGVQHPTEAEEQPQHALERLSGQMIPTSIAPIQHFLTTLEAVPMRHSKGPSPTCENGKVNGSTALKHPRPGDPLVDVVAALDRSRLRKVVKPLQHQVGPKVDERDSLLEQIRTKSFNLRPAGVPRPIIQRIQGPKTNLRVAAILEKANAIRQATAGSDEDDDDSWSDS